MHSVFEVLLDAVTCVTHLILSSAKRAKSTTACALRSRSSSYRLMINGVHVGSVS